MTNDWSDAIAQVKAANDIVDVIGGYLVLHPNGPRFKGLCPFHDDSHPSMQVDPEYQNFRCWACGKSGDVFTFVQEFDRVSFPEALELLAQRAGISLEKNGPTQQNRGRAVMLTVVSWSDEQFQKCLLDSPLAERARVYLGQRRLAGGTIREFGLGYAPVSYDWLVNRAREDQISLEALEEVGVVARSQKTGEYYDRFRDRVMFPIRNMQGKTVGFGGRILPDSSLPKPGPKYYNSCETPLFNKSELLYGIDRARRAATDEGVLVVMEGYTDVLMAQQLGIHNVVATMGTALNERHVNQLKRVASRVVLVFDGDAGGTTGVDRALELFVRQDLSLDIATLPEGMDPYDFLVEYGVDALRSVLTNAQDVLEFKLEQWVTQDSHQSVETQRRTIDSILAILALGSDLPRQADQLKRELIVTRIAQKFGTKEETIWARLAEIKASQKRDHKRKELRRQPYNVGSDREPQEVITKRHHPERTSSIQSTPVVKDQSTGSNDSKTSRLGSPSGSELPVPRKPALPHERELLEVLLAEPKLVVMAAKEIELEHIEHPGLRCLLEGLFRLQAEGQSPTLDMLRARIDNKPLLDAANGLQQTGQENQNRVGWLQEILSRFRTRQEDLRKEQLQSQIHSTDDQQAALELLRKLQNRLDG
ncbi:MAG: DNA primase [Gemmataceae bacterium]